MSGKEEGSLAVLDEIGFKKAKPKDKKEIKPTDGRKPPKNGVCRRCGLEKKLNRLRLCYRCWVITNIEEAAEKSGEEWKAGDPHPDWCQCILPDHQTGDSKANPWN